MLAGWVEVQVRDLLFTALLVLAPAILLGTLRPAKPWRWTILLGIFVPIADLLAYFLLRQRPDRAQIYESFLVFLPALVGAYGGAFMRGVLNNVLQGK
jgi:ABC-type multidrug transport system permease subunit